MRILIVSGYYPPNIVGGGDISTLILSEGLAAEGADVCVLTCAESEQRSRINGVTIDHIRSPNIYWRRLGALGLQKSRLACGGELQSPIPARRRAKSCRLQGRHRRYQHAGKFRRQRLDRGVQP
jgi:hypothetical protein